MQNYCFSKSLLLHLSFLLPQSLITNTLRNFYVSVSHSTGFILPSSFCSPLHPSSVGIISLLYFLTTFSYLPLSYSQISFPHYFLILCISLHLGITRSFNQSITLLHSRTPTSFARKSIKLPSDQCILSVLRLMPRCQWVFLTIHHYQ